MKIKNIKINFQASHKFQNIGGELEIELTPDLEKEEIIKALDMAHKIRDNLYKQLEITYKEVDTNPKVYTQRNTSFAPSPVGRVPMTDQHIISPGQKALAQQYNVPPTNNGVPWTKGTLSKAITAAKQPQPQTDQEGW